MRKFQNWCKKYELVQINFNRERLSLRVFYALDYSEDEITRTTAEIKDIIHILLKNKEISNQTCNDIISAWNTEIPKKSLLEIRNMLCKEYREDILIFKQLFKIDNPLITVNEMKSIGNNNVVLQSLINYGNASFDDTYFEKVCELLKNETLKNAEVQAFFIKAYDIVTKKVVVEKLLSALEGEEVLPDEVDSLLRNAVSGGFCSEEEYIKLLEKKEIPDSSIHKVYEIGWSKGLSEKLCNALYQKEYYVDYIVNAAVEHIEIIDFSDKNVIEAIKEYAEDIFDRNEKAFKNIRLEILKEKLEVKFEHLFLEPFLGINEEELYIIDDVVREIALMEKNTPELTMEILIKHFNSKYHGPLKTVQIIDFIHNLYNTSQDFSTAFYKLDMDNVRFRSISKANRARILTYIKKLGNGVNHKVTVVSWDNDESIVDRAKKVCTNKCVTFVKGVAHSVCNFMEYDSETKTLNVKAERNVSLTFPPEVSWLEPFFNNGSNSRLSNRVRMHFSETQMDFLFSKDVKVVDVNAIHTLLASICYVKGNDMGCEIEVIKDSTLDTWIGFEEAMRLAEAAHREMYSILLERYDTEEQYGYERHAHESVMRGFVKRTYDTKDVVKRGLDLQDVVSVKKLKRHLPFLEMVKESDDIKFYMNRIKNLVEC